MTPPSPSFPPRHSPPAPPLPYGPPPGWGPPPYGWNAPLPQPSRPTKTRSFATTLVVLVVFGLPMLVGMGAQVLSSCRAQASLRLERVPTLIDERVKACVHPCRVISIATSSNGFWVTIPSQDVPGRTLTYSVAEIGGEADLMSSRDWPIPDPTFDPHEDVDWKLLPKILKSVNDEAARGHRVDNLYIGMCRSSAKPSDPVRVCVRASVLTPKGNEDRVFDAKTGRPYEP